MSHVAGSGSIPITTAVDAIVSATPCRVTGVSVANSNAAAQTTILYDNASAASGTKLVTVVTPPADTSSVFFGDEGIGAVAGVYADAGTTTVVTVQIKR